MADGPTSDNSTSPPTGGPPAASPPEASPPEASPPDASQAEASRTGPSLARRLVISLGAGATHAVDYLGGVTWMLVDVIAWFVRSLVLRRVRFGRHALYTQIVRVGVRSIAVILLVSGCIGLILALQMAPPLSDFGQTSRVATIIAIAVVRELGPLISGIVLTGFAGAAIAAELGTMVVGEEIEALQAHALNPIRFLVLPRVLATTLGMIVLTLFADFTAIGSGWLMSVTLLDIPSSIYIDLTLDALDAGDLFTGLFKGAVFGLIIGLIACYNGLSVRGGAAGVGYATTLTVVYSIVSLIVSDLIFTALFYRLGIT